MYSYRCTQYSTFYETDISADQPTKYQANVNSNFPTNQHSDFPTISTTQKFSIGSAQFNSFDTAFDITYVSSVHSTNKSSDKATFIGSF
jgi:hypothetical protein